MVSLYYTAFKESSVEYENKGALTERLDINNCTDLWIVLSFVNSECDAEIASDTVIWRILKEIWQKFKKTIKLFDLTNSFQSVYSLKTGFIIPLGINDSNGTGSHCKLQKWRNIILIHSHSTSENTVNNFVDSFSLRTQAGQQLWHWAEPGFPGSTAKGTRFLWNWTPCSTTPPLPGKCPLTDGDSLWEAGTLWRCPTQGCGWTATKHTGGESQPGPDPQLPPAPALHTHKPVLCLHYRCFAVCKACNGRGQQDWYTGWWEHKDATQAAVYQSTIPSLADHISAGGYLCYTLWFLLTTREPCKYLDLYHLLAAHSLPEFKDLLWKYDNAQAATSAAPGNAFLALTLQLPVSSSDSPLSLQQSLGT